MQLNLLTRLGERIVMTRAEPPSTVPGAWRDSAISQLEALARANERAAARARRRRRLWVAGVSGLVLLWGVSLWRQAIDPPRVPAPLLAQLPSMPSAVAATVAASPAPEAAATDTPVVPLAAASNDATVTAPTPVVTDAVPVVASDDEDAARKARALARRKAAQERTRAEQEAQQRQQLALAAQLDAERALQQQQQAEAAARERAAAAERERRQAQLLAASTRRGVAELCGQAGGWAAEQQCQVRQCWRAEHQADAVCLRLRETDVARLQRGADH